MSDLKLLIDTNVVLGLEDNRPLDAARAELIRLSSKHGVRLFVDYAVYEDVQRDRDEKRRVHNSK